MLTSQTYLLKKYSDMRLTSTRGDSENGWNAQHRPELWKMKTVNVRRFVGLKSRPFRQCCLHCKRLDFIPTKSFVLLNGWN